MTRMLKDLYPQKDIEVEVYSRQDYVLFAHWDARLPFSALSGPKYGVDASIDGGGGLSPRFQVYQVFRWIRDGGRSSATEMHYSSVECSI